MKLPSRRERLSARLGDILSWLYLASTVLKRYEDSGRPDGDLPFVRWAMQDALYKIQQAFYGLFENLPGRLVAVALRHVIFSYGREFEPPSDRLGQAVVAALLEPCAARERVTAGIFIPKNESEAVGTLEAALRAVIAAEAVEAKMRAGVKAGTLTARGVDSLAAQAVAAKLITGDEAAILARAQALRRKVIMVDDFPLDLGKSEIFQTTQAVTFETLQHRRS